MPMEATRKTSAPTGPAAPQTTRPKLMTLEASKAMFIRFGTVTPLGRGLRACLLDLRVAGKLGRIKFDKRAIKNPRSVNHQDLAYYGEWLHAQNIHPQLFVSALQAIKCYFSSSHEKSGAKISVKLEVLKDLSVDDIVAKGWATREQLGADFMALRSNPAFVKQLLVKMGAIVLKGLPIDKQEPKPAAAPIIAPPPPPPPPIPAIVIRQLFFAF